MHGVGCAQGNLRRNHKTGSACRSRRLELDSVDVPRVPFCQEQALLRARARGSLSRSTRHTRLVTPRSAAQRVRPGCVRLLAFGLGRAEVGERAPITGHGPSDAPQELGIAAAEPCQAARQAVMQPGPRRARHRHLVDRENPFVERLIGSARRESLDHVLVLSETHPRRILARYFAYYHWARTHLARQKDAPDARPLERPETGAVVQFPEVGLHHRYVRRAA